MEVVVLLKIEDLTGVLQGPSTMKASFEVKSVHFVLRVKFLWVKVQDIPH